MLNEILRLLTGRGLLDISDHNSQQLVVSVSQYENNLFLQKSKSENKGKITETKTDQEPQTQVWDEVETSVDSGLIFTST